MNHANDILWANSSPGGVQIWFMDGHQILRRKNVVDEVGQQIPSVHPGASAAPVTSIMCAVRSRRSAT